MYQSKTEEQLNTKTIGEKNGDLYYKFVSIQNAISCNFHKNTKA